MIYRVTLHQLLVILSAGKSKIMSNIVEVVVADKSLATMSKNVKAVGLDTVLSQKGPFTIFAPTDIAFNKLTGEKMTELEKNENSDKLTDLLKHHIVDGAINIKDLKDDQKLTTINGRELQVKIAGDKITINGANIETGDHKGSNGIVHSLDEVIELK